MKIAKYDRVPQEVVAAQYDKPKDAEALAVWMSAQNPTQLQYVYPYMIRIRYGQFGEQFVSLAPGDWVVKLANGQYKRMSDGAFKALYAPKGN